MKIRHERPMANLEYKVRAPLRLELQSGENVVVREWSQSGLTYPSDTDVLPKKGFLTIPFQGVDVRFPVAFKKGQGPQDLTFHNLTGRQRETLGMFYRLILSGKMAATDEVITSLDTPVDLVPMGETEEEEAEGKTKAKPRILRIIWNVVFYAILAFVLFGLIGTQIWDRLSSVPLSNGRVVAPITQYPTGEAAYVDAILVVPGDAVRKGDTMIRLSNPDQNAELEDIRRDISRARARVREARALYQRHLEEGNTIRAQLLADYQAAIQPLSYRHFTSGWHQEGVQAALAQLKRYDAEISVLPGDFYDLLRQFKSQFDDAKEIERRLKRDLSNAKDAARTADIVADRDGRVTEILVFENEYLPRGKITATLEENTPRFVRAWLNEARAEAIYVGMDTEVRFRAADGKRLHEGVIEDITAGVDPTTDNGFGMIVSVRLLGFDLDSSRTALRPDAPVRVRALKDWRAYFSKN